MDTSVFIGLSTQKALRREMDIVANNVANMNTTAYKRERVVFREYLVEAENAQATTGGKVSYVLDYGVVRNLDQGAYQETGNPLDLFIDGSGYIAAEGGNGETIYARNGRMKLDEEGFLTLFSGERVLDKDNRPIQFEPGETGIQFTEGGLISSSTRNEVAQMGLYRFANEQQMNRRGNSTYTTQQAPLNPADNPVTVKQFAIEGSNVNGIKSIVDMTRILRSYQSVSKNLDSINQLREDSLQRLARVE